MSGWWKSRSGKLILGVLFLLVVTGVGLQWWLNSGIGKGVIETRLSAALGRPVRLGEDLSIKLLPAPGAVGSQMQIFSKDGQQPLLEAGEYLAQLELWPLLSGAVEVVALQASGASLDIGVLSSESSSAEPQQPGLFTLPAIRHFELSDTNLYFEGIGSTPYIRISALDLEGLKMDQQARFQLQARLILDGAPAANVLASGLLRFKSNGSMDVELLGMDIQYDTWEIYDLTGRLTADLSESILDSELIWGDDEQALSITTRVSWEPDFVEAQDGFLIEEINLLLDGHAIEGEGCLLQGTTQQLNLDLSAPSMQLGDLKAISEKWKSPATASPDSSESSDELPFELGARLLIDQASYEDTRAEGIVITIGEGPNCPERL